MDSFGTIHLWRKETSDGEPLCVPGRKHGRQTFRSNFVNKCNMLYVCVGKCDRSFPGRKICGPVAENRIRDRRIFRLTCKICFTLSPSPGKRKTLPFAFKCVNVHCEPSSKKCGVVMLLDEVDHLISKLCSVECEGVHCFNFFLLFECYRRLRFFDCISVHWLF